MAGKCRAWKVRPQTPTGRVSPKAPWLVTALAAGLSRDMVRRPQKPAAWHPWRPVTSAHANPEMAIPGVSEAAKPLFLVTYW